MRTPTVIINVGESARGKECGRAGEGGGVDGGKRGGGGVKGGENGGLGGEGGEHGGNGGDGGEGHLKCMPATRIVKSRICVCAYLFG